MDDELHSTPPSSWSCGQFSFPTESSEEPSSMLFNHPQHAYVGLHPGFDTTAPGVIPPDHITNDPTSAFSMNHTYNDHTKCSQRQHMNSWNQWTSAQGETAWTTARTTVPISAEQQPCHLLNPFDVQMDHSQRWQMFTQEPTEIFFTNEPNPELNTTLRKNSRTTDHNEIQEETHSAREERDFGEILNRAMSRASGRLIALLQEELERLSRENELVEDVEETDEALATLSLDNRTSRCRL